jgi:alpha-beta hydrolase superfamily lysophospholipase
MNNASTLQIPTEDAGHVAATVVRGSPLAVLLCHGRAFDRESLLTYASELAAAKLTVAALDFRGYGKSVGGTEGPTAATSMCWRSQTGWLGTHTQPG